MLKVFGFADLATASIAEGSQALLRLVDGSCKEFSDQRPLHMLLADGSIYRQYCKRYPCYHYATLDIR